MMLRVPRGTHAPGLPEGCLPTAAEDPHCHLVPRSTSTGAGIASRSSTGPGSQARAPCAGRGTPLALELVTPFTSDAEGWGENPILFCQNPTLP